MAVNLSPYGGVGAQFFSNNGVPLAGGKIFTYAAGTTTPQATYTSASGVTAHANPIILDAAGRVPGGEIWLTDGLSYKFVLKDANDITLATYDNVVGINSNFINYTNEQEIQTATAGQTVFTLTTMQYQPGTGSLSVFVDGVNQYGPGAQYAFVETDSTTVTFVSGLHVGASVKFTTSAINASSYGDAFQISYTPPFTGSVATNVGDKLAQTVSVKDFGAVGDGVADDTAAIQAAIDFLNPYVYSSPFNYQQGGGTVFLPKGMYRITDTIRLPDYVTLQGQGRSMWLGADQLVEPADGTIIFADFASTSKIAIDSAGYDTATGLRYTALTPRPNADYLSGAMTYTHGVGIKELSVKCDGANPIEVGIRLNGSPLSMMQDVAVWGFKTGYLSVACWCNEYNNIIGVNQQIGIYMGGNNACKVTGILDNVGLTTGKYSGFGGTDVTALNKPIWWNASDTIYCSTSIYLDGCRSIAFPEMTSQNGGRGLYANNSNFSFGTWYTEAYPFNADSTGVVNGADSKCVFSNWYHDSNGCTLLQHNYNFPVTILALSGIWGLLQGVDGTGPALLGQSTVRNYAFPDRNYDPRLVPLVPSVVNEIYVFENAGFGNNNFIGDINNPVFNLFGATARLVNGKKNIIYLSNSVINYDVYDELVWSGYDIEIRRYGPGAFQPTIQFQVATGGARPGIRVENTTLKTFGVDLTSTGVFASVANTDRMFGINGNSQIYINDAAIAVTDATTGIVQALAGNAFNLSITYISCAITGTGYLGAPSTTGTGIVSEAATKLVGASGVSTIAAAVQAKGYGSNITVLKSYLT